MLNATLAWLLLLMRKNTALLLTLIAGFAFGACDRYSHTTPQPEKTLMEANKRVYGEPGGPPRQAANQYPTNPDAAAKAQELKEKLFNTRTGETLKSDTSKTVAPVMGE